MEMIQYSDAKAKVYKKLKRANEAKNGTVTDLICGKENLEAAESLERHGYIKIISKNNHGFAEAVWLRDWPFQEVEDN